MVNLPNPDYKKKNLSPEDDWDLIYQEALEARKVLAEARNTACVKFNQLLARKNLFFVISMILLTIGLFLLTDEYLTSGSFQEYLSSFYSNWSIIFIGALAIFLLCFNYINLTRFTLIQEIDSAEEILYELDRELFATDK